jgi:cytidylate kinase
MSVVTISRGSFSGGKILAECLSRKLGYRCIDRDVIVERAAAYGVSQDDIRQSLERPPGFLDRFNHKRYRYVALVQAALAEEVRTGRVIYHGLAGHLLLKGGHPILRIRIVAPMEFRIQMVQHRLKYTRSGAIAHIEKVDEDRRKWVQFLYGVDWRDPSLYDLVLNLEYMTTEEACRVVSSLVLDRRFEFTPEHQQTMDDLALGSRVRADLAVHPSTLDLDLEVVAQNGAIAIKGKVPTLEQIDAVKRVARAVHGVTSLNLDKLSPPVVV